MEPDISSFCRQFFTARAAVGWNGPLPGYQVAPSELAQTKPISLGLTNLQQTKPEKEANLPLPPSLEAWLTCQATTLEGKRPAWESLKLYPKLPSSRAELFEPSNAPSLLRVGQLPLEGRISPETVSFTGWSSASSNLRFSKILAVFSDLDWWVAGVLVSQAGDRLQGDVSLESNAVRLDTLAKESQDHKARTLPPPKRFAPPLTTLVSSKKPSQILSPRAEVGLNSRANAISPGNPPIGEKAVEQKRAGTSLTFGHRRA